MKAIVTGASGMLGSAVYRELRSRKVDVQGWAKTTERDGRQRFETRDLALGDFAAPLEAFRPDLIVHCAAMTDADYCEKHRADALLANAWAPGGLAGEARRVGARFIHVSTDAVYDDEKPGRRHEDDQPKPQSVYASTKLEGEGRVLSAYPEALVVRTTMFGWTLKTAPRPKFAEQILGALTARTPTRLFRDAYFSPLHVEILADVLLELAEEDVSGVLNVGARRPVSKAEFGGLIADTFGLDPSFIETGLVDDLIREDPKRARRTKNVGLDVRRVEKLLGPMPTVEDGVYQLYQEAFDGTAKRIRGRETYP